MKSTRILITATLALLATPLAIAQDSKPKPAPSAKPAAAPAATAPAPSPIVAKQMPSYPMTTCVACGKALPEHPVEYVKGNRLYRLDAEACQKAVDSDAAGMAKKIDEAVIAQQKATYPLKTSPVSDKPLEAGAVDHVYGTRLVRLASSEEVAAFEKDPAAAMAKVDKALIDSQLASYTMKKCPVSGEDLGEGGSEPVNYLYGTKLVRFCCKKCPVAFEKDPAKYMKAMAAK
jgi:YHS domain-containing protein